MIKLKSSNDLVCDACSILNAGLDGASVCTALRERVRLVGSRLHVDSLNVGSRSWDLAAFPEVFIAGFGKASVPMAEHLVGLLGDRLTRGVVISNQVPEERPRDQGSDRCVFLNGSHPLPSPASLAATRELTAMVDGLSKPDQLLICLVSGGGSAMLVEPRCTLDQLAQINGALLRSGAPISEVNAVRKRLSHVKGGQLGRRAAPATVVSLICSDVVIGPTNGGDPTGLVLQAVASGPTAVDRSSASDAAALLHRVLDTITPRPLDSGVEIRLGETVGSESDLSHVTNLLLLDNTVALGRMRTECARLGFYSNIVSLGNAVEGESRSVGEQLARQILAAEPGTAVIAAGETTVSCAPGCTGRGGRNQETVLAAGIALSNSPVPCLVASVGTDGNDHSPDYAGANVTSASTVYRDSPAATALADHDSTTFFETHDRDALIITGATGSNVADIMLALKRR